MSWWLRSRAPAPGAEADAVLYALEASQPPVSQTKLAGLVGHYGFVSEAPGTTYFRVHAELDKEHAAEAAERLGGGERQLGVGASPRGDGAGGQLGTARRRRARAALDVLDRAAPGAGAELTLRTGAAVEGEAGGSHVSGSSVR